MAERGHTSPRHGRLRGRRQRSQARQARGEPGRAARRAPGKKKAVAARSIRNNRLIDALNAQAFASLNVSPGARAFYDELRTRGIEHNDAMRRLANRLAGVLHGCLKTRTLYDEATA
jgi:hypothetical protein